jgi:hypothetical protein
MFDVGGTFQLAILLRFSVLRNAIFAFYYLLRYHLYVRLRVLERLCHLLCCFGGLDGLLQVDILTAKRTTRWQWEIKMQ